MYIIIAPLPSDWLFVNDSGLKFGIFKPPSSLLLCYLQPGAEANGHMSVFLWKTLTRSITCINSLHSLVHLFVCYF